MSDLEEDLLALAGAGSESESDNEALGNKRGSSPDKSQQESDYDIGDADEDDVDEEDDDYDIGDIPDEDEEEEEPSPYPLEGKYKNEKDKAELESMAEMERESILFERSQELQKYNERKLLAQRAKQNQAQQQRSSSRSQKVKESSRSVKSSKLSELKKQREKKSRRTRDDYDDEDEDEDEEEDDYDLGELEEDDYEPEFNNFGGEEVKWAESSKRKIAELSDINKIKTGHSVAEKFCFYPGFSSVIVGTFGKIRVNKHEHRMVRIEKVIHHKPYTLGSQKTDQQFVVSQPGKDKKNFNMSFFSDEPITESEFSKYNQYINDANEAGKRAALPTLREIEEKYQELKTFATKKLEGSQFDEFIRRRSMFNDTSVGANYVLKKSELTQKLQVAKDRHDTNAIRDYSERLRKLENHFQKSNKNKVSIGSNSDQFAKVNERNRKMNMKSVKEAELINTEKRRTGALDKTDPFRRLNTRSRVYYKEIQKEENEKAKADALETAQQVAENQEKEKQLLKAAKYRNLGEFDKLVSGIDFKFDIQI
ncbi:RNA polymerase-associated protein rtf1 [Wickerhamomyces ciferrii]|uniref:RNA polymerase-associated protein rtf1 n=1 Tax=Wickerhamomyces ciferrii (strain ATCC 14091 / BCRC 22168 / CBS 111 / JCM 3599 / NBRC 0793 / NRRL Y-1031 F-60-10) TaxID=1206466 RepID=K0KSM0_WICCF|nr:RNA polymerase-associated protein rtf1 [Wickerhamomyces ciferrii]CCH44344.1 RNA polymerase-associated protein rtf1 [Wickerhamomyces ciferrii]